MEAAEGDVDGEGYWYWDDEADDEKGLWSDADCSRAHADGANGSRGRNAQGRGEQGSARAVLSAEDGCRARCCALRSADHAARCCLPCDAATLVTGATPSFVHTALARSECQTLVSALSMLLNDAVSQQLTEAASSGRSREGRV